MSIYDHIERWGGEWNTPSTDSETLGLYEDGYAPKLRGGCMGIIPYNDKFVILGEDDDHYWEECVMTRAELKQYLTILKGLAFEITVVIDHVLAKSTQTYTESKKEFFSKDRNVGEFNVSITDRGETSPLVRILNSKLFFDDQFDVSWAARKAVVCKSALNP